MDNTIFNLLYFRAGCGPFWCRRDVFVASKPGGAGGEAAAGTVGDFDGECFSILAERLAPPTVQSCALFLKDVPEAVFQLFLEFSSSRWSWLILLHFVLAGFARAAHICDILQGREFWVQLYVLWVHQRFRDNRLIKDFRELAAAIGVFMANPHEWCVLVVFHESVLVFVR